MHSSAPDGCDCSALHPMRFLRPGKEPPVPVGYEIERAPDPIYGTLEDRNLVAVSEIEPTTRW